jgi:homoaconitate hydratase
LRRAASAVAGRIAGHREFEELDLVTSIEETDGESPETETEIFPGFPDQLSGELLFLPKDNMNTDGIYGKDVTYRDDLTPEEMATHAFRNYDPEFQTLARRSDLLVGGKNFGSGSSREQAATAIKFFGIPIVIAASFSQTYKRNAFNNGFPVLECPSLVEFLRERCGEHALTIRTGLTAIVDFRTSTVRLGEDRFPFLPLGEVPQRLVVAGGTEALVRETVG